MDEQLAKFFNDLETYISGKEERSEQYSDENTDNAAVLAQEEAIMDTYYLLRQQLTKMKKECENGSNNQQSES